MLGGEVDVVVVVGVVAVGCFVFLPGLLVVAAAPLESFHPRIPGGIIQHCIYLLPQIREAAKKVISLR